MTEFWKQIPPNEPYRVILGEVRDRLYQTRERSRHLLAHGFSDIPEEATFTNVEQVFSFIRIYFEDPVIMLLSPSVFRGFNVHIDCTFPSTQLSCI